MQLVVVNAVAAAEMPIDRITLRNIDISTHHDATFQFCKNIKKDNVNIKLLK